MKRVHDSRQCIICRKRTGAITAYRFFPRDARCRQFSAYAHKKCFEQLRNPAESEGKAKSEEKAKT